MSATLSPDRLYQLVKDIHQASTAAEILQRIGQTLQEQIPLEAVWIGYPAEVDDQGMKCYWVLNGQQLPPTEWDTPAQVGMIPLQDLQSLLNAPDHLLRVAPGNTLWESLPASVDRPQVIAVCCLDDQPAWLLGLVAPQTELWLPEHRLLMGSLLELTTLALQRQQQQQQTLTVQQHQRTTANRLMDRLRVATEATRQVIYEWDILTDQLEWSTTLRTVFGHGLSTETELRQWWIDQIHADDLERVLGQVAVCLRELQVFQCEYRWRRADGFYAWVRDYGRILCGPQGSPVRMVGSLEEITARKSTAAALQLAQEGLRTTLNLVTTPLLLLDADSHILQANTAFQQLLCYDLKMLQSLESLALIIHPADLNADALERQKLTVQDLSHYHTEKRFFHAQGQEIATDIDVSALGDAGSGIQMLWQINPK